MRQLGVALVGYGYWGPNIARNLQWLEGVELRMVCDLDVGRLAEASRHYPAARTTTVLDDVLAASDVDAVVVSTPADSHYEVTGRVLAAGKHALVEKPLAMQAAECDDLAKRADEAGLTLMVGHTFLYNPALRWVRERVVAGDLGDVLYLYTQRLNLGRVRQDVNVLWNLAPHDIAILLHLVGRRPVSVTANGHGYVQPDIEDVVFLTMEFPGGCLANVHVSWLDPRKVRRVTVVGARKMVVYDDVDVDARVQVYDKGIDIVPDPDGQAGRAHDNLGEFQTLVRSGDLLVPRIEFEEPLGVQCREFVDAIREGRRPLTDAAHAREVVAVLEAADASLRKGGERIFLDP